MTNRNPTRGRCFAWVIAVGMLAISASGLLGLVLHVPPPRTAAQGMPYVAVVVLMAFVGVMGVDSVLELTELIPTPTRSGTVAWIDVKDRLPCRDDRYLVHCESGDPDKPFTTIAWYHPDEQRWTLLHPVWVEAITHWAEVPPPPKGRS